VSSSSAPRPAGFTQSLPSHSGGGDGIFDVLVVCTGNICRSPMGEALLRARLADRGVAAHVHSAGTLAWGGNATGNAAIAMRELGIEIDAHHSTALTRGMIEDADLVLGMTREHVWRVTGLSSAAAERAFLVGELARLGASIGPRDADGGESIAAWALRVVRMRPDGHVGRAGDEVDDPMGEPLDVYRETAARLDRDLTRITELLFPFPASLSP
jgi:protein-tyrosine phosphatase